MWIQVILLICINVVYGDVYMQNKAGSNNRLDGRGREVRNNRRLFNSQNNDRGGYNVGRGMEYYAGSTLRIEWTNQHSSGGENNNCELIVQYMCDEKIRDGASTTTIPEMNNACRNKDCNTDMKYGMHEDYEYYTACRYTQRNTNLYTSTKRIHRTAKYTRQNPNGRRYGYECPEERDYYPYWRPTPWKDVVVMTSDKSRCDYYEKESQNVKSRFYCKPPASYMEYIRKMSDHDWKVAYIPTTEEECKKLKAPTSASSETGQWIEVPPHKGTIKPDCKLAPKSRDNHNGNGIGGETNFYEWKLPKETHSQCILRIRYNISTNDFDPWTTTARDNAGPAIHQNLGLYETTAKEHGYVFNKDNPVVKPFRVLVNGQNIGSEFKLKMAMKIDQYGRTFQDRSHAFSIVERPKTVPENAEIVNVNVRGKRGNIVQTYPATEYDFVPNSIHVKCERTYIHFQWTGSNNNPNNNDGEGTRGTDRSNVCLMGPNKYLKTTLGAKRDGVYGHYGVSFPADMRVGDKFLGMNDGSEQMLCTSGTVNGDNGKLDEAGSYYNHKHHFPKDGGLVKCRCEKGSKTDSTGVSVKLNGVWYYMCTRNNNFTNRSQKAKIICEQ